MAPRNKRTGRFTKRKRTPAKRRRTTTKGMRRRTARRAFTGLKRRRRRRKGTTVKKSMMMKQAGAAIGAGTLGALLGGGTIQAKYANIPTSVIAAAIAAAGTMWSRNDALLGASLGLTGMAAAELGGAMTSSGIHGMGDQGWARSTYAPAEDMLGYGHDYADELLGEDEIWSEELEI